MRFKKLTSIVISTAVVLTLTGSQSVFASDASEVNSTTDGLYKITGFTDTDPVTLTYAIGDKPSESDIIASLPTELTVQLNGSDQSVDIPVTWEDPTGVYDSTDFYCYGFEPVWDTSEYTLGTDDSSVPMAWVTFTPDSSVLVAGGDSSSDTDTVVSSSGTADSSSSEEGQESSESVSSGSDESTQEKDSDRTTQESGTDDTEQVIEETQPDSTEETLVGAEDTTANRNIIYSYLTGTMGLNSAAACGVLANIEAESSFRANVYGDSGTSYGICQWHASRFDALKNYASQRDKDYSDIYTQLDYLNYELTNSYSKILNYIKNVSNNQSGAGSAATEWCMYYEIPANRVAVSATRASRASSYFWPIYGSGNNSSQYSDVSSSAYYFDAVAWAVSKGVTQGTGAGNFSPDGVCTRAQAVTFLWRAAGSPQSSTSTNFTDVNSSDYYSQAVSWAVSQGITKGTDDTHFSPGTPCNRAMIVEFLYRAAGASASQYNIFWDVETDVYYAKACTWASENGITSGKYNSHDHTYFCPNAICTRAEMVTFLYRYYN